MCFCFVCSDAIIDPAAIFAMLFGSELFEEYIGQLAMASMASLDIFTEGEQFDAKKVQEKMRVMIYCILFASDLDLRRIRVFIYASCLHYVTCIGTLEI